MTTVRTLHLYGELADRYGALHRVAANTMGEAVRIVDCNHPGFCHAIRRKRFHIALGDPDIELAKELPLDHLFIPRSRGDWHLVPAMEGGKSGTLKTVFSIVVGGALLATGIGGALGGIHAAAAAGGHLATSAAFAASSGFLGLSYGTLTLMGAAVFLGGINQLLAPAPQNSTSSDTPTSFSFGGPTEVDTEGGPIFIICGEVITAGIRAASSVESTSSATVAQLAVDTSGLGGIFGDGYSTQFSLINSTGVPVVLT